MKITVSIRVDDKIVTVEDKSQENEKQSIIDLFNRALAGITATERKIG